MMDPNATLNRLLDAIYTVDREDAHEALDALLDWIDADGFPPADPRLG